MKTEQRSFAQTWNGGTFATITDTEGAARLLALMGAEA